MKANWRAEARRGLCAIFTIIWLAGCATTTQPEGSLATPEDIPQYWSVNARLALANGRDGGSGQLNWQKEADNHELQFVGAFGRGSWKLSVDPSESVLRLANGEVYSAPKVSDLIQENTGWDIPLESLQYWLIGLQAPSHKAAIERDRDQRIRLMQQQGWLIEYKGFHDVDGYWLPRKLYAKKDGNEVRLSVRLWNITL